MWPLPDLKPVGVIGTVLITIGLLAEGVESAGSGNEVCTVP